MAPKTQDENGVKSGMDKKYSLAMYVALSEGTVNHSLSLSTKSLLISLQVDWNDIGGKLGYTNPRSAANAWASQKQKFAAENNVSAKDADKGATAGPTK